MGSVGLPNTHSCTARLLTQFVLLFLFLTASLGTLPMLGRYILALLLALTIGDV